MNCNWSTIWPGLYLHHSWTVRIMLVLLLAGAAFLLHAWWQKRQQKTCPGCNNPVQEAYLRCPQCGKGLKSHCSSCNRIVETSWQFCPHCQASLTGGTPPSP